MENSQKLAILCGQITGDVLRDAVEESKWKYILDCSETTQLIYPLYENVLDRWGICLYRYLVKWDFDIKSVLNQMERDKATAAPAYKVYSLLDDEEDYSTWEPVVLMSHISQLYKQEVSIGSLLEDIKDQFEHSFE